ncbi:MAG TPA: hypothetical protein VJ779_16465 [Acetobacteraceae bacterium]|nr:hypothetical protein [Acetobacteraceae bacterium]
MQTEIAAMAPPVGVRLPSVVARLSRNRLALGGIALALLAAGLAWQWSWLVAIGVPPLLLSAAPCAAMCALGLCMHRMGGRSCGNAQDGSTAHVVSQTTSIGEEK